MNQETELVVYVVIERYSGDIEGVFYNQLDAKACCDKFDCDLYDMQYEKHTVRRTL